MRDYVFRSATLTHSRIIMNIKHLITFPNDQHRTQIQVTWYVPNELAFTFFRDIDATPTKGDVYTKFQSHVFNGTSQFSENGNLIVSDYVNWLNGKYGEPAARNNYTWYDSHGIIQIIELDEIKVWEINIPNEGVSRRNTEELPLAFELPNFPL